MNKKVQIFSIVIGLIILLLGVPLGLYSSTYNDQTATWEQKNQQQLINELNDPNIVIVDLREESLYKQGHIPNAINIPFTEITERYVELNKDKKIVFVCHTGSMGEDSSQFLINNGYMNVSNLTGGMAKWSGPIS
ncbi:rhodanese-like domain-containing protein [Chengkuizengella marina]|uniref:Rhodanese-like domain-containing protein n=1 Tax=Chengkuizengella marina TaxID=2507566 RepID=A0A6N9Q899_9BACL|nr:rhodanese-like domain-containing protein [Chengkuizengella marina]NBI30844.1 rhodanese-like domain-containing protein [Chengkuizengella marina]